MRKIVTSVLTIALLFSVSTNIKAEGQEETGTLGETSQETEEEIKTLDQVIEPDGNGGFITQSCKVQLDQNYTFDWLQVENQAKVTIDLNGYNLTISDADDALWVVGDETQLVIVDHKAEKTEPKVSGANVEYTSGSVIGRIATDNNGAVWLESGTIQGEIDVYGNRNGGDDIFSAATINGGYVINNNGGSALNVFGDGAVLWVNDGVIKATGNAVVAGSGSENCGGTTITIQGGKFIGTVSDEALENGDIACGIYQPQDGILNISGGLIYVERGVGVLARSGKTYISGEADVIVSGNRVGKVGSSDLLIPSVAVYNDLKAKYPGGAPSIEISGGLYSNDVSEYLENGYKVVWSDEQDRYEVIDGNTTDYEVVNNEIAIDEIAANSIDQCIQVSGDSDFNKGDEIIVTSGIYGEGDTYYIGNVPFDFSEQWNKSEEKVELTKFLSTQENVSEAIPLAIYLEAIDASWNHAAIETLTEKANATLFLDKDTLSKVEGKKYTLYRIYNDEEGFSITPVTEEKTSLVDNAIPFSSDKFACIYAIVTYKEPLTKPTITSETVDANTGDLTITWTTDQNAKDYTVVIDDETYTSTTGSLVVKADKLTNGKEYTISITANPSNEKDYYASSYEEKYTYNYTKPTPTPTSTPTAEPTVSPSVEPTNTPTATPTASAKSSSTTKTSSGWDDGGPFTTDSCGNVFDRWGNKIYEAKGCNVGGYNLVRTSVED